MAFLFKLTYGAGEEVLLFRLLSQLATLHHMLSNGDWLLTVQSLCYTWAQHFSPKNPAESHEQQQ